MSDYAVGQKIDFKKPGSGRGRPSSGTIKSVGLFLTVTNRLGKNVQVHPTHVVGEHVGSYVRKEVAEA